MICTEKIKKTMTDFAEMQENEKRQALLRTFTKELPPTIRHVAL
jgi:hypothetical protein